METKTIQKRISKDHEDSFWYDGIIAETEHFRLVATGEIKIVDSKTDSIYDNKPRDSFRYDPENDTELAEMNEDTDIVWDMNNWFAIYGKEDVNSDWVVDTYSDGIEQLQEFERNYKLN